MVENEYIDQIYEGGVAKLQDKLFYLGVGDTELLNETERNFLSTAKNVLTKKGRYASDPSNIRIIAKDEKGNEISEENLEDSKFAEQKNKVIELKRDRDLALKAIVQYKFQRDSAIQERNKANEQLKIFEDKHFN